MNVSAKFSIASYIPWGLFFAFLDLFSIFLVWLANPAVLHTLVPVILLSDTLLFAGLLCVLHFRQKKQIWALSVFLENPCAETLHNVLITQTPALCPTMQQLLEYMLRQTMEMENLQAQQRQYQEFIEEWTHNIKTPLSLATLVLDNHKEEMSPYVYRRMNHVRQEIQTDIDMILYYARLQGAHLEYRFESILLQELINEILFNYREQMNETGIFVETMCPPLIIVSDRKVLTFILSQLLNNAFQYTPHENGKICICGWETNAADSSQAPVIHLAVRDNGAGVPTQDIPFLFDKGFTGNHPDRRNATGMGLYLVAKYADALAIDVIVEDDTYQGKGFAIRLSFPAISHLPSPERLC